MDFPKARSCASMSLALGGSLSLSTAHSQDHLLPGPPDSGTEGGSGPERWMEKAVCLVDGEKEQPYQL